jgi:hypothetical protein
MPEEGREYLEEREKEYNNNNQQQQNNNNNNNRYGRIREVEEGHSRAQQRKLALHRKSMVFDLSSKGYNQNRISAILHVSQALVSLDLAQLRKDAANSMKSYLEEKLPLIYQECYEGISQVISRCWEMINDANTPTQTRVQLLALVADATQTKLDISCGGEVIENGIKYAQHNINNRFVAIAKPEEILHSSDTSSEDDNNNTNNTNQSQQGEEQPDNLATKKDKGQGGNDDDNNNSLTADNNVVGNNNNDVGSNGNENINDNNVIANDDDSNKEEDYTTDPFDSYSSSFSSSSSSYNTNTNTATNNNTNNNNNRRTKNSVF